ncbi:winged helix-turn-helix domain-containing protein [Aeromonas salmonicida subsp. salmonicida]|nr:winged helix-turn-helix domain-containing protein [Aeromonas salmonicida subsp. salmonicida]
MTEPSKTRTSFYRRLYVAWLISSGTDTIPAIMAATGMPRRTAQDTLAALADLNISCGFEQTEGARHLQGHYRISDWGPINPAWIKAQLPAIKQTLSYP